MSYDHDEMMELTSAEMELVGGGWGPGVPSPAGVTKKTPLGTAYLHFLMISWGAAMDIWATKRAKYVEDY